MGNKTLQASALGVKDVIDAYWKLTKEDKHTVKQIYTSLLEGGKIGTLPEVKAKIKIMKILSDAGVEPSQTINQELDEVSKQIALKLQATMGSNRVGNLLSIPYRRIDELFDAQQVKLDAIKWEKRLKEKIKSTAEEIRLENGSEKSRELQKELNRLNLQLENLSKEKRG